MTHLLIALTLAAAVPLAEDSRQNTSLADEQKTSARQREQLRKAATALLTEVRSERVSGLPSPAHLKRLAPMITPELRSAIERARDLQQEQMRKHPDEKPQWVEGDLFSSLFEGVKTWELGEVFAAPSTDATVKVHNAYDEPGLDKVEWTDTWVFKRSLNRWLLDDIRMGGDWAFRAADSLRHRLPGGGKEGENHFSPDEKWQVTFTRRNGAVTRVTILPQDKAAEPFVLFGGKDDEACPMPTWVVWSPSGDFLALRLGESPRFTRTRVFHHGAEGWKAIELPEFYPNEKKTLAENGFKERDRLIDAEYWRDSRTLVVQYFGSFTKNEEGDGFHKLISVRFGRDGKARVVEAVDAPGDR